MVQAFVIPQTFNVDISFVECGLERGLCFEKEGVLYDVLELDAVLGVLVEHDADQLLALLGDGVEGGMVEVQRVLND